MTIRRPSEKTVARWVDSPTPHRSLTSRLEKWITSSPGGLSNGSRWSDFMAQHLLDFQKIKEDPPPGVLEYLDVLLTLHKSHPEWNLVTKSDIESLFMPFVRVLIQVSISKVRPPYNGMRVLVELMRHPEGGADLNAALALCLNEGDPDIHPYLLVHGANPQSPSLAPGLTCLQKAVETGLFQWHPSRWASSGASWEALTENDQNLLHLVLRGPASFIAKNSVLEKLAPHLSLDIWMMPDKSGQTAFSLLKECIENNGFRLDFSSKLYDQLIEFKKSQETIGRLSSAIGSPGPIRNPRRM